MLLGILQTSKNAVIVVHTKYCLVAFLDYEMHSFQLHMLKVKQLVNHGFHLDGKGKSVMI